LHNLICLLVVGSFWILGRKGQQRSQIYKRQIIQTRKDKEETRKL